MEPSTNGHSAGRPQAGAYAVVSYVPDPLGAFLRSLRTGLAQPGAPLAPPHVTVVPPRNLLSPPSALSADLDRRLSGAPTFEITLGDIQVFEATRVIYLSIAHGECEIEQLHQSLGAGLFAADEPFPFHPHLTLAQEIPPGAFAQTLDLARRLWRQCPTERTFAVESLSFVRNRCPLRWELLTDHSLEVPTLLRTA